MSNSVMLFKRKYTDILGGEPPPGNPEILASETRTECLYEDPKQHVLALKLALRWKFYLPSFDDWLDGFEQCAAKEDLVERRMGLVDIKNIDQLRLTVEFLNLARRFLTYADLADPKVKTALSFKTQQKEKAKKPRISVAAKHIHTAMRLAKAQHRTLKDFLISAENGSLDGIRCTCDNKQHYSFTVETADSEKLQKASHSTLERWWTEVG
jgi:hypothetical protein